MALQAKRKFRSTLTVSTDLSALAACWINRKNDGASGWRNRGRQWIQRSHTHHSYRDSRAVPRYSPVSTFVPWAALVPGYQARHRLLSTRSAYPLLLSRDEDYGAVSVESGASVVYVKIGRNDCVEHRNIVSQECSEYRLYSVYDLHPVRRKKCFAHLHSTSFVENARARATVVCGIRI
jgi:hypothetical protein